MNNLRKVGSISDFFENCAHFSRGRLFKRYIFQGNAVWHAMKVRFLILSTFEPFEIKFLWSFISAIQFSNRTTTFPPSWNTSIQTNKQTKFHENAPLWAAVEALLLLPSLFVMVWQWLIKLKGKKKLLVWQDCHEKVLSSSFFPL